MEGIRRFLEREWWGGASDYTIHYTNTPIHQYTDTPIHHINTTTHYTTLNNADYGLSTNFLGLTIIVQISVIGAFLGT